MLRRDYDVYTRCCKSMHTFTLFTKERGTPWYLLKKISLYVNNPNCLKPKFASTEVLELSIHVNSRFKLEVWSRLYINWT